MAIEGKQNLTGDSIKEHPLETRAKSCIRCQRPARSSIVLILSVLKVRPRVQKCSRAVLLCAECLHGIVGSPDTSGIPELHALLSGAFTAIPGNLLGHSEPDSPTSTTKQVNS
jgi:hypothetical protein